MPSCDWGASKEECGCRDCQEIIDIMIQKPESYQITASEHVLIKLRNEEIRKLKEENVRLKKKVNILRNHLNTIEKRITELSECGDNITEISEMSD